MPKTPTRGALGGPQGGSRGPVLDRRGGVKSWPMTQTARRGTRSRVAPGGRGGAAAGGGADKATGHEGMRSPLRRKPRTDSSGSPNPQPTQHAPLNAAPSTTTPSSAPADGPAQPPPAPSDPPALPEGPPDGVQGSSSAASTAPVSDTPIKHVSTKMPPDTQTLPVFFTQISTFCHPLPCPRQATLPALPPAHHPLGPDRPAVDLSGSPWRAAL